MQNEVITGDRDMSQLSNTRRTDSQFVAFLQVVSAVVFLRFFCLLLVEYRWYFPADFVNSTFLSVRRDSFHGSYLPAFYLHILVGPWTILLGIALWLSGEAWPVVTVAERGVQRPTPAWHRFVGRVQWALVCLLCVTGLRLSMDAFAGPIAGLGFACLSVITFLTISMAGLHAYAKRIPQHRVWAKRGLVLLASPFVLRAFSGIASLFGLGGERLYAWNAWLSWMAPLAWFELHRLATGVRHEPTIRMKTAPTTHM